MIEDLIKDGYSIKIIAKDSTSMLNEEHKSKIAIILDDSISDDQFKLTKEYMSNYKEVRIFNKAKEK